MFCTDNSFIIITILLSLLLQVSYHRLALLAAAGKAGRSHTARMDEGRFSHFVLLFVAM